MKSILLFSLLTLPLLAACVAIEREIPAQPTPVTMQVFYDELSPFGKWMSHPTHGYVWMPMEDPDTFFPYGTNGHWVWTEYGWTWVSDYKWGWAPFHYGRWDYEIGLGWFWIPDVVWGPAWVAWSTSGDYYGWAPMRPGIGITIVIEGRWVPPAPWWIFVHHRHMGHRHIRKYYERKEHHGRILGESRVINRTHDDRARGVTYLSGPDKIEVEKASGVTVVQIPVVERTRPGQSFDEKTVSIFRPTIERTPVTQPKPVTIDDPKPTRQTPSTPVTPLPQDDGNSNVTPPPVIKPQPRQMPPPVQMPKHDRKGEITIPKLPPQQPKQPARPEQPAKQPPQPQRKDQVKPTQSQAPAETKQPSATTTSKDKREERK